jgi:hypothetical protein
MKTYFIRLAALETDEVVAAKVVIIRCRSKAVNPLRCSCCLFQQYKAVCGIRRHQPPNKTAEGVVIV